MASVTLLGTKGGPAVYPGSAMPTSSLVQMGGEMVVVDCGLGVSRALTAAGIPLSSVRTIVITHLHSDHYLELGPLIHTAWTAGLNAQVTVYGPSGLGEYWRHFLASMAYDIKTRIADEGRPDLASLVAPRTLEPGAFDVGGVRVRAIPNRHPPVEESYALSFEADGRKVVFSGDTAPFEGFAGFAHDADLLIHEVMHAEGIDRLVARVGNSARLREHLVASHTVAADAGRVATEAGVKALALHHFVPSDDPAIGIEEWEAEVRRHWSGRLYIGTDGLRIDLD
jgi:ribonuclease BN (tRNA processing enzyme)